MITKTQLLAILAIVVQLLGQLGFSVYAETLQTIGASIISILVLFGIVQNEKVKAALKKAKMM